MGITYGTSMPPMSLCFSRYAHKAVSLYVSNSQLPLDRSRGTERVLHGDMLCKGLDYPHVPSTQPRKSIPISCMAHHSLRRYLQQYQRPSCNIWVHPNCWRLGHHNRIRLCQQKSILLCSSSFQHSQRLLHLSPSSPHVLEASDASKAANSARISLRCGIFVSIHPLSDPVHAFRKRRNWAWPCWRMYKIVLALLVSFG